MIPARFSAEACRKTSFPPLSSTTKPNPLAALYHFTVPISWTFASKGCRSDGDPKLRRDRLYGAAAVLLSTLMTSVTCGPRSRSVIRNASVSPERRVGVPMPASAVACKNASPDHPRVRQTRSACSGHTISLSPKPAARRLVPRAVVQQHPRGPGKRFLPLSGDPPRQPAVSRHPRLFGGPGRISLLL